MTPELIGELVNTAHFNFPFSILMKHVGRDDEADRAWKRGLEALETLQAAYPRPAQEPEA